MQQFSTLLSTWRFAFCFLLSAYLPLSAQTVIGGNTPDNSALLDVQSNNKGMLFPRMTTAERDDINNGAPAIGLIIFNTTTGCLEINLGAGAASWQSIKCPVGSVTSLNCSCKQARQVGSHLMPGEAASMGRSVRVPYTGGDGLNYEGQTVASTGVTGLTATLAAGTFASGNDSLTYTITGVPDASGLAVFALDVGGQTCTLNVPVGCGAYVDGACTWKVFSCYNLGAVGATTGADPFTPSWELNGDYYQWGRSTKSADGPSGPLNPNSAAPAGWSSTQPATSWSDSGLDNNPCPSGFRVPTITQWEGVNANNAKSNPPGASWAEDNNNYESGKYFGPGLFLPTAGNRQSNTGVVTIRGWNGYYWSSTLLSGTPTHGRAIYFHISAIFIFADLRATGFSVRCIAVD